MWIVFPRLVLVAGLFSFLFLEGSFFFPFPGLCLAWEKSFPCGAGLSTGRHAYAVCLYHDFFSCRVMWFISLSGKRSLAANLEFYLSKSFAFMVHFKVYHSMTGVCHGFLSSPGGSYHPLRGMSRDLFGSRSLHFAVGLFPFITWVFSLAIAGLIQQHGSSSANEKELISLGR